MEDVPEQIFPISKSEHMLSYTTSSFENWMYLKFTVFLYHSLKSFSEKNYKKKAQIFNQLLALLTDEIFCSLFLRNYSTWNRKMLDCFAELG